MRKFLKFCFIAVLYFVICSCAKTPQNNVFLDYGKPAIYPSPFALWQTIIGGTKDDAVKDVFCYDGFIYIIGESNSYDCNFTSAISGQKIFLGKIGFDGQLKNIWFFAASNKQNSFVKSVIVGDYLFVLCECALKTKSAVLFKINLNSGQSSYRVLGSGLLDEYALDLIYRDNKLYIIGQNFDSVYDTRNLFIEQLDINLNQKNYQRIVKSSDLKYIGCIQTQDSINIWINAVAIEYSYPVMIDIGKSQYIYYNFENPMLSYRLMDAASLGGKTLLIFAEENKDNNVAYCFFEDGKFQNLRHISKNNILSARIMPCQDYATVFLNSQKPSCYLIDEKHIVREKNLNQELASPYKYFKNQYITAALGQDNNNQKLIITSNYNIKIMDLAVADKITAFWIEKDYLIIVSNIKGIKDDMDIKVMLLKTMPYYFS